MELDESGRTMCGRVHCLSGLAARHAPTHNNRDTTRTAGPSRFRLSANNHTFPFSYSLGPVLPLSNSVRHKLGLELAAHAAGDLDLLVVLVELPRDDGRDAIGIG